MSSSQLKIIGLVTMLADHIGKVFLRGTWWMQYVGRLAFPIFAYQTAVGYQHTGDLAKYVKRLAILAGVSQLPYSLMMWAMGENVTQLNIGFTLLIAVMGLVMSDSAKRGWKWLPIVVVCAVAEFLKMDYGAYGVLVVGISTWLVRLIRDTKAGKMELAIKAGVLAAVYVLITIIKYLPFIVQYPGYGAMYGWQIVWAIMGLVLVLLHNGKKGKAGKKLFYIFYPVHMLAVYILYMVMI